MSSSLPNAMPQFVSIATAVLPSNFVIKEGSIYGPNVPAQGLLITGIHFLSDTYGEMGPLYRHEEHYNMQCVLVDSFGMDDHPTLIGQLYGLYSDISVAVANAPTLNGTVRLAWTRQLDYSMGYDAQKGWSVGTLTFEVECQARVNSLT